MRSFTAVFLLVGTCYAAVTLAIGDLDFLNEEFLQDQLDHYAKVDPSGLEALKNGMPIFLFTRPKLCGLRLGAGSQVIVGGVVVIIQTSRKSLGFQKPSSST